MLSVRFLIFVAIIALAPRAQAQRTRRARPANSPASAASPATAQACPPCPACPECPACVQPESQECPDAPNPDYLKYESIIAEAALVRSACMKLDSDKLKQLGDWAKMSTVLGGVSAVGGTVSAVAGFVGAKKAGEAVGTTEKLESAEALSAYESALIDAESAAAAGQVAAMRNSSEDSINLDAAACGNFSSDLYGSALDLVSRVKSDKVKEYKDLTDSDLVVMINLLNITYSPQPGNPEYEAKMLAEAKRLPDHPCGAFLMAKYAAVEPARDRLIGNMGGLSGGEDAKNAAKTAKTAGIFAGVGGAVSAVSSGVTAVSGAANWKNFESQIEAARNCRAAMESFDRKLEQFYNDKKKEKQDENKD